MSKPKPTTHVWLVVDRNGEVIDWLAYRTRRAAAENAKRMDVHWPNCKPHRAVKFERREP